MDQPVTQREIEELRAIYAELQPSSGPLVWAVSETDSLDETIDLIRAKLAHYPDRHAIYGVQTPDDTPDGYTLCITGNGPKAAANAEWLSVILPAIPGILNRASRLEAIAVRRAERERDAARAEAKRYRGLLRDVVRGDEGICECEGECFFCGGWVQNMGYEGHAADCPWIVAVVALAATEPEGQ